MTNRLFSLLLIFFLWFSHGKAQDAQPVKAAEFLQKNRIIKAKKVIDSWMKLNPETSSPQAWFTKGDIYLQAGISSRKKFKQIRDSLLLTSYVSFQIARNNDKGGDFTQKISEKLDILGEEFFREGVLHYSYKNYQAATTDFEHTFEINEYSGKIDTLTLYNAAISAQYAGNNTKAIKYYKKLMVFQYNQPAIYISLSDLYKKQLDTLTALQCLIAGTKRFPTNKDLLRSEYNLFSMMKDTLNARSTLTKILEADQNNPEIYFGLGVLEDQMGNSNKAEDFYKKAIALKPDYFDANFNLGILYYNQGITIYNVLRQIGNNPALTLKNESYAQYWEKAIPYLEQANRLNPQEPNTKTALTYMYNLLHIPNKLNTFIDK